MAEPKSGSTSQRFDAGMPDYSDPSRDDFVALSRDRVPIRSMTADDLDAIVRIDKRLTGRNRRKYYQRKLENVMSSSAVRVSLVAEIDGIAAGYIMARVDYGEFGTFEPVAVIDTIGVDPGHGRGGIGHALMSQLMANLSNLLIEVVRTELTWDNFQLLDFLKKTGFTPSQHLVLTKHVE